MVKRYRRRSRGEGRDRRNGRWPGTAESWSCPYPDPRPRAGVSRTQQGRGKPQACGALRASRGPARLPSDTTAAYLAH